MSNPYLDKLRTVNVGSVTRDQIAYGYDNTGQRTKAVTDELGNTQTEHIDGRVDVNIKAPTVHLDASLTELRD